MSIERAARGARLRVAMKETGPLRRSYRAPTLTLRGREFVWGERTYIMAVINLTPDSFSGDGLAGDVGGAVALARRFEEAGADLLDVGAESSRPGGEPVSQEEELRRLLPALAGIREATALPISVDTWRPQVAEEALAAGADLINDIHGLRRDPGLAHVIAAREVPAVVMNNQRGRTVTDVIVEIRKGFDASLAEAARAGIAATSLILDPGFGFGWTVEENLEMVRRLPELWAYGLPLLVGVSRKSALGAVLDLPVDQRLEGTISAVAISIAGGADLVRVHDVEAISRAARVADAIVRGSPGSD